MDFSFSVSQARQQPSAVRFGRVRFYTVFFALQAALLAPSLANAEIYKSRDRYGRVVYTDVPRGTNFVKVELKGWRDPTPTMNTRLVKANMEKYRPYVETAAKEFDLPLSLLHAVITVESAYNPTAVSKAGAMGLMQLMPGTAERFGVRDTFRPDENIRGGSRYLSYLMGLFNGDLSLVLAAYNAGEGAVMKYGNNIPPYAETQNYVRKVQQYQRAFNHPMDS